MQHFLEAHKIEMAAKLVESNPNMADDWAKTARHYACTFSRGERAVTFFYSQGPAIEREPEAADVLACICSDAASVDCNDFLSWAADLGYDTDSRRAEATFQACRANRKALRGLLGPSLYKSALLQAAEA